ncbi:hypothetical protein D3C76_1380250 [compost metagenome]
MGLHHLFPLDAARKPGENKVAEAGPGGQPRQLPDIRRRFGYGKKIQYRSAFPGRSAGRLLRMRRQITQQRMLGIIAAALAQLGAEAVGINGDQSGIQLLLQLQQNRFDIVIVNGDYRCCHDEDQLRPAIRVYGKNRFL